MTSKATQLLFLIILHIIPQDVLVKAHLKNPDGKILPKDNFEQFKDSSSNEILGVEMKQKLADQHHYYHLPMQTTFGSSLKPSAYGGAITSPPHLSISPSSAETNYGQSSQIIMEKDDYFNDDHITPYLSQCITETPSKDEHPESELLLPSKELMPESVVLSGHIEIASKTSSEISAPKISNTAAELSFVQGTQIHMSSITDI